MIWLQRILLGISGLALIAIMLVMSIDAIGRYVFTSPLTAAFEIVQLLMAVLVFSAIPVVTLRREHVVVDLFEGVIPPRPRRTVKLATYLVCSIIALVFAWVLYQRGGFLAAGNETTANLGIRMAPLAYAMAVAWFLCALAFLVAGVRLWRDRPAEGEARETAVG